MKKKFFASMLIVAMTLGTAWAVRGHFGHEQGAAWAGAIGALALILTSRRKEWYKKMLVIALSSAFGWGITGMISYGIVVGYGRSDNLPNAFYGYLMLFVIGGLFGLLGGGMTGLSLESSKTNKVKWANLLSQMVAGGLIVYGFLINQLEWLMTPPRNETWAICLGAALAMFWYMRRNNFSSAFRVSIITGIGSGFGFAFGNFLQTVGTVYEIQFNMWNVMEYSIGFFGGLALAYSVFTSKWPEKTVVPKPWENVVAFLVLFVFIPLVIFQQSLQFNTLVEKLSRLNAPVNIVSISKISSIASLCIIISLALISWLNLKKSKFIFERKNVMFLFVLLFSSYIALGYIIKGVFIENVPLNIHLYVLNLIIILFLLIKIKLPIQDISTKHLNSRKISFIVIAIIIVIFFIALIAISIHDGIPGAHHRFSIP